MGFTNDFGLRPLAERRETIALFDSSVDQVALTPALTWFGQLRGVVDPGSVVPEDVPHARALAAYMTTGDYSGIPLRAGEPPPDRITYRPLTVVERAAIDSLCRRIVPDGNGGIRIDQSTDERAALAFALAADVPGWPATIKREDGREVPKRRYDPRLGRERMSDEYLDALVWRLTEQPIIHVGNLILRGSEAAPGDRFRGRRDGVAQRDQRVGPAEAPAPAGPAVRDVPGEPAGGTSVPGPGADG